MNNLVVVLLKSSKHLALVDPPPVGAVSEKTFVLPTGLTAQLHTEQNLHVVLQLTDLHSKNKPLILKLI